MISPELEINQRTPTKDEWKNMAKLAREALENVLGKEGADLEIALTRIYLIETKKRIDDDFGESFYFNRILIEAARMNRKTPALTDEERKVVDTFSTKLIERNLIFSQVPNSPRGLHRMK